MPMKIFNEVVETGDPDRPFLARIMTGKNICKEWPVPSFEEAERQGEEWMRDFNERIEAAEAKVAAEQQAQQQPTVPRSAPRVKAPTSRAPIDRGALPTASQIKRMVNAARSAGVDVAGFRVWPDGSIAV